MYIQDGKQTPQQDRINSGTRWPASLKQETSPALQLGAVNSRILIIIGMVAVVIVAGAFWYISQSNSDKMTDSGIAVPTVSPQFVVFKDIITNLLPDETEEMHFMQVDIALVTRSRPTQKVLEGNLPVLRNALLDLLATWTFAEIQKPENRNLLRQQALSALHKLPNLPHIKGVESVLITNLVVQ